MKQALGTISVERWKLPRTARDTTATNLDSIARDLAETLPPLLAAADSSPASASAVLPVSRNLTALYEVLLRLSLTADTAAPKEQSAALEQALASVQNARRTLEDRAQASAAEEELQIGTLRSTLAAARSTIAAAPGAPAATPPPCPPAKKKKPAAHSAALQ